MRTKILIGFLVLAFIPAAGAEELQIRSAFDFVRAHGYVTFPNHPPAPRPPPPLAPDYLVGDTRDFWSWDLSIMPPRDVLVPSTCRAVGTHAYIFVADDQWNVNVTQQDVDLLIDILDNRTPPDSIDPAKGIIPNEVDVFGPVPDALDGDPKPIILLMELAQFGGNQFDGYFNAFNQYPNDCHSDDCYHSNECEMITVNSAIRPVSSDMTVSILAHEFQHLIHWGGDPDEESWVNESCSEAAMIVCGYHTDIAWMNSYLQDPSVRLDETDRDKINYGVYLLFGTYLYERFGAGFLRNLVANPTHGQAGITTSLSASGSPLSMDELLLDWATATVGDHLGVTDPLYSHPLIAVGAPSMTSQVVVYPLDPPLQRNLAGTGTAYVRLAAPPNNADVLLSLQAQPEGQLQARVLMVDGSGNAITTEFVQGEATASFSANPQIDSAYLVMVASIGGQVSYTLTAEAVSDGEDGGVADAADGGDVSDTDTDAGADTSDGGTGTDETTGNGDGGCGCGTGAGQALPLLLLFVFLPLRSRLRYPVGR
jgi:hypothetical protein